jgi:hypothetical protein
MTACRVNESHGAGQTPWPWLIPPSGKVNRPPQIPAGMAVTAEVKTGKRRAIEYFLSPLLQCGNESLRER